MKKFLNKKLNTGITLIALVITIVVLIILATVVINLSLGDNGIFNRAREAKEQYQNAQDDEESKVAKSVNAIDSIIGDSSRSISKEELKQLFQEALQDEDFRNEIKNIMPSASEWQLLGTATTGTGNSINLPTNYNELCVVCTTNESGTKYYATIQIPKSDLTTSYKNYLFGSTSMYTVHHGIGCEIKATTTNMQVLYIVRSAAGDGYTTSGTITVYYR